MLSGSFQNTSFHFAYSRAVCFGAQVGKKAVTIVWRLVQPHVVGDVEYLLKRFTTRSFWQLTSPPTRTAKNRCRIAANAHIQKHTGTHRGNFLMNALVERFADEDVLVFLSNKECIF